MLKFAGGRPIFLDGFKAPTKHSANPDIRRRIHIRLPWRVKLTVVGGTKLTVSACDSQRLVYHTDPALVSTARCRRGGSSATADTCRHCYHHTDSARIIRGRVYVTIRCPSVCPSVCPILSRSRGVRRWFAAVGRAGRGHRSIAVWRRRGRLSVHIHSTVASSECEQCRVYSC